MNVAKVEIPCFGSNRSNLNCLVLRTNPSDSIPLNSPSGWNGMVSMNGHLVSNWFHWLQFFMYPPISEFQMPPRASLRHLVQRPQL
mmetsp:Transcript_30830/g.72706  ORF Transcript_30830/g.72706 Transcript_30830/m.72706 type:complete len:86 (-) Transcript_30830:92-349(-)